MFRPHPVDKSNVMRSAEPPRPPAVELDHVAISVDTFYASVATEAVKAGADIVNDVSGGTLDAEMFSTVR